MIKPAPPRTTLTMFGGNLSIQEFRSYCCDYSTFQIEYKPPMVPIVTSIQNINLEKKQQTQSYIPLDLKKVSKAEKNLQSMKSNHGKRKKLNTLENCMNLKYV